jgi:hypothetical protein
MLILKKLKDKKYKFVIKTSQKCGVFYFPKYLLIKNYNMKKRIVISESERQKILSQHKSVIKNESELKKQSLSEREMSKLINNVLLNEGLSVKNNNRVVLSEANWCNQNVCASQGYETGTCNYFGNGAGNCVFADGSVCGWTTASEAGGGEFVHWSSGPCGMSTQGGNRPSKLPKPTTTTPTAPTGKPKPISTSTTTTKTVKENSYNGNGKLVLTEDNWCNGNICNTGLYGNGNCSYFGNGVGNCVFSDGSVCGWDTGANGPQWTSGPCHSGAATQGGATPSKLPKPTTTTPTGKPKPISTSTTTTKTVKETKACFGVKCSCQTHAECGAGKRCVNGNCEITTSKEMKEASTATSKTPSKAPGCMGGMTYCASAKQCCPAGTCTNQGCYDVRSGRKIPGSRPIDESDEIIYEIKLNEDLTGPASGNALNACGTGNQSCWSCPNGCGGGGSGVYMGWSISDSNQASSCGCSSWSFGMPLPQYDGRKLPKPTTTTPTAPTGKPKPVSNTTTTMKESIVNRLFRKVLSEMKNSECETKKDCGGLPCVNGRCKNRTEVKEVEGCFNPTCSCKSDKECSKGKTCINGKCTTVTNREMKEDTELYERAGRAGDSCNCGTSHTAGVVKCGKMGAYYDCWCDCSGAQKDRDGDGYPG